VIKLGIAGCRRGRAFVPILHDAGFTLAGAMDPDPDRLNAFAKEAQLDAANCFDRFEPFLECGADAVLLASPMPNHAPQAIAALERGIHVLSEVPAAISFDQCLRLRDAAVQSNAAYMMAENAIHTREAMTVAALARAGTFGEIYYAEGAYLHDVRDSAINPDGSFTWRKQWQFDRRGATYATHALGPPLHWMDDRVVRLSAIGSGSHIDQRFGGDDTAILSCTTNNDRALIVRTDLRSPRPAQTAYYQVQGGKGCYEAAQTRDEPGRIAVDDGGTWKLLAKYEPDSIQNEWNKHRKAVRRSKHGGADFFTLLDFAKACKGEPTLIGVHRALDYTLPGLVSERSIEQGGIPLEVPDPRTNALDQAAESEQSANRFPNWTESVD
jgi:predicted dehydrogenase